METQEDMRLLGGPKLYRERSDISTWDWAESGWDEGANSSGGGTPIGQPGRTGSFAHTLPPPLDPHHEELLMQDEQRRQQQQHHHHQLWHLNSSNSLRQDEDAEDGIVGKEPAAAAAVPVGAAAAGDTINSNGGVGLGANGGGGSGGSKRWRRWVSSEALCGWGSEEDRARKKRQQQQQQRQRWNSNTMSEQEKQQRQSPLALSAGSGVGVGSAPRVLASPRRLLCGSRNASGAWVRGAGAGGAAILGGVGVANGGAVGGGRRAGEGGAAAEEEDGWRGTAREVQGFLLWMAVILVNMAQIPLLWFVFWEYVCPNVGNPDPDQRVGRTALPMWLLWIMIFQHIRRQIFARLQPPLARVMLNGEIFIAVSVLMTICANFSTLVHRPRPSLFDVGFYLIPAQGENSPWRPLSDILTLALPGLAFFRALYFDRRTRCRFIADWFRLMSVTYLMRCLCVTLTSLPGPALHCATLEGYNPPQDWHDVATRMGPLMGDFRTCGDLLFSGHTAWTTVSMLLLTKSFRRAPRLVYGCVKVLGLLYLLTMATLTIAGRKHYTVDVALAVVIAGLTFFRFQDGMIPRRQPSRPASGAPSPNGLNGVVNGTPGHHAHRYPRNLRQHHHGGGTRPHPHHKRKLTAEAAEDLLLDRFNGGHPAAAGKRGGGGVGDAHPPPLAASAAAAAAAAAAGMSASASASSVSGVLTTATNRGNAAGIGIVGDSDRGGGVGGLLAEEGGFFARSTAASVVTGGGGSGGRSGGGARGRSGAGGWLGRGAGGDGGEAGGGEAGGGGGLFWSVSRPVSRQHRTRGGGGGGAGNSGGGSGSIVVDRTTGDDWLSASDPAPEAGGEGDVKGPLLAGEAAAEDREGTTAAAATTAAERKAGVASASGGLFTV
eukprot:g13721.t2